MSKHTIIAGIDCGAMIADGKLAPAVGAARELVFEADANSQESRIIHAPSMFKQAKAIVLTHTVTVKCDEMGCNQTTVADIYANKSFAYTDMNTLGRVT